LLQHELRRSIKNQNHHHRSAETTTVLLLNIIILLLLVLEGRKARVVAEGVAARSQQRWKTEVVGCARIAENEIIEDPPAQ
jgi:hypothetical protein